MVLMNKSASLASIPNDSFKALPFYIQGNRIYTSFPSSILAAHYCCLWNSIFKVHKVNHFYEFSCDNKNVYFHCHLSTPAVKALNLIRHQKILEPTNEKASAPNTPKEQIDLNLIFISIFQSIYQDVQGRLFITHTNEQIAKKACLHLNRFVNACPADPINLHFSQIQEVIYIENKGNHSIYPMISRLKKIYIQSLNQDPRKEISTVHRVKTLLKKPVYATPAYIQHIQQSSTPHLVLKTSTTDKRNSMHPPCSSGKSAYSRQQQLS